MNELTAELHALSLDLAAAGVFSTVDPGEVLNLVQRGGVCALVEPTTTIARSRSAWTSAWSSRCG